MSDIAVYRAEGEAAASGGDLYGFTVTKWDLPATYPPFAALLFIPTTWVSLGTLKIVCVLVNAGLLALLIHLSRQATAPRQGAGLREAAAPRRAAEPDEAAGLREATAPSQSPGPRLAGPRETAAPPQAARPCEAAAPPQAAAPPVAGGLRWAAAARRAAVLRQVAALRRVAGLRRAARIAPVVLVVTALGLWLEPVFQTFVFGQVNLALTCLVLWDLARPDGARGKGFATGLAAGIKLTPAIFAVYLLITGRVKAAFTALAGFLVSVLLGWLVLPDASVEFWTRRMFETDRVGKVWIVDNQSLQGLISRVLHNPAPGLLWAVPALLTAAAGLYAARRVYLRRGLDSWGVLCTAVTALLVSPISWSHHWVWCVPLLIGLAARVRRCPWRRALLAAVTLAFTARTMWIVPHRGDLDLHFSWWQQPLAAPYPLLGLALLAALIWWTRRTGSAPGEPGEPGGAGEAGKAGKAGTSGQWPGVPAPRRIPAARIDQDLTARTRPA
ncbi:glycosyltransferase 87 family protein [Streptomyces sp. NPDC059649]|uniref:glycosyltransferase 87 family protein n=1 Tax=Streptomyces sp. NPDC059649 TaxID=3346895 RepID=UPI0036C3C85E